MIYCKINSLKMKTGRNTLSFILILSMITAFSSCMTTHSYYENPETYNSATSPVITKIELKNGEIIDCKDKILKFETNMDSVKFIVINSYVTGKENKTYWTKKQIPVSDILRVYMEKSEVNGTQTTLLIVGLAAAAALIIAVISSMHSMDFKWQR